MPSYKAPLDDMRFVLHEVLNVSTQPKLKGFEVADAATVNSMLQMAAQFSEEVLAPLNASGDREGCVFHRESNGGSVTTPKGFKEAYQQFCANGLTALSCDPDPRYGGLGMPVTVATAIGEMFCSANLAFGMYPGLSHGAYNALHEYGTDELKEKYLPKLVTGEWSGTMCLTEPHAGTDLGLIKTKAVKQADGSYKIYGGKIFISSGEHDLTSNILHLVLAKIDDPSTPPGVKGISLFIVPKFLPDAAGNPGARNAAYCARIEEKMGIHGNSTCEMTFDAADGWLVGEAHKGMKAMFVMMNEARLGVGLQGLGLSEVAYQNALLYAIDRKQGQKIDEKAASDGTPNPANIIKHPDIRRELLTVKAQTEAGRMLAYWTALQLDISQRHEDEKERKIAKDLLDFLTPIVKAHFTDNAVDHTNAAMQVFGGHGYIKEHGMEQFNRDARITRIYEGANGIQALDLIGRKVLQQNLLPSYIKALKADIRAAKAQGVSCCMTRAVKSAACRLQMKTTCLKMRLLFGKLRGKMGPEMVEAAAIATDYLKLASLVVMGHMWIRMAGVAKQRLKARTPHDDFYATKLDTARFYMDKVMPQAKMHIAAMKSGAAPLMKLTPEQFGHGQTTVGE